MTLDALTGKTIDELLINPIDFVDDAKSFNAVVAKKEKRYETNWARMEPFIVASGRLKISNMILPNIENVVRCHTDGIILKKPIANVKLGSDIGDLKFEESGTCHIINSNDFKFKVSFASTTL